MNLRLLVIFGLFCTTLAVASGPQPPTEYRVLWTHTQSYTTRDYAKAKASYEADLKNARYGWAQGIGNRLQKRTGNVWADLESHQQPYDEEGPVNAPPPKY
jgi:hypothetical protein